MILASALEYLAKKEENKFPFKFETRDGSLYKKQVNIIKHITDNCNVTETLTKNGMVLAGGCLASIFSNTPINDIDLFAPSAKEYEVIRDDMNCIDDLEDLFETKNTFSVRKYNSESYGDEVTVNCKKGNKIVFQFVNPSVNCGEVREILTHFDFTCCMAAYNFGDNTFTFHPDFFSHLASKTLYYSNYHNHNPINNILRLRKYQKKGFDCSVLQMMKMFMAIQGKYKTFGDMCSDMNYLDKSLSSLKKHIFEKKLNDTEFTHENLIKILDDSGMDI